MAQSRVDSPGAKDIHDPAQLPTYILPFPWALTRGTLYSTPYTTTHTQAKKLPSSIPVLTLASLARRRAGQMRSGSDWRRGRSGSPDIGLAYAPCMGLREVLHPPPLSPSQPASASPMRLTPFQGPDSGIIAYLRVRLDERLEHHVKSRAALRCA